MAKDKKQTAENVPERALFFELELLAVPGWSYLYDTLKKNLAEHDVKLTLPVFAKYFVDHSMGVGLKLLANDCGNEKLSDRAVLDKIKEEYLAEVKSSTTVQPGVAKLISDLRKHGIKLGAITCLDDEAVDTVLNMLGLTPEDIHIMKSEFCGRAAPTAQDWLRIAKEMQISKAMCTAAATSAASCKAALCAGMRCFALPDKITAYQDFGGADFIFDSLDDSAEDLVLKLVEAF